MPRSSVCPLVVVLEAPLEKSCLLIHWRRDLPVKLHPSCIPCHSVCEQGRRLPGASCIRMCSCSVHAAPCMECPPPHKILPTFYGPAQMSPLLGGLPRHSSKDSSPLLSWNLFILVIQ